MASVGSPHSKKDDQRHTVVRSHILKIFYTQHDVIFLISFCFRRYQKEIPQVLLGGPQPDDA